MNYMLVFVVFTILEPGLFKKEVTSIGPIHQETCIIAAKGILDAPHFNTSTVSIASATCEPIKGSILDPAPGSNRI